MSFRRIWIVPTLPKGARVLELGAGAGDFAWQAVERGWDYTGYEPTQGDMTAEAWARQAPRNAYAAIFMWQVIEHLDDPWLVTRSILSALSPGGLFICSTPSIRSLEHLFAGDRWDAYGNIEHKWWWSPRTISFMLRKVGFTDVRVYHQRIVKHVRGPWWFTLALGTLLAACRLSSRITVVARKGHFA